MYEREREREREREKERERHRECVQHVYLLHFSPKPLLTEIQHYNIKYYKHNYWYLFSL